MINLPAKPINSTIEVQTDFNRTVLSWKNPSGGFVRFAILVFLLAWMGGWVMGEKSALNQVLKGPAEPFLVFWLVGWTVGGIFCATVIFRLVRPSRREKLTLEPLQMSFEPGTEPFPPSSKEGKDWNALALFRSGRSLQVARKELGNVRIDRVGERQRLSFDHGAKRVEIGQYLEEPEREWLLAVLNSWKSDQRLMQPDAAF